MVEAVPAVAHRLRGETLAIQGAGNLVQHIVFAGGGEKIQAFELAKGLLGHVEFAGFRQVADVAGMQNEGWALRQIVNFGDGQTGGAGHVGIGVFVKTEMGVADLGEMQSAAGQVGGLGGPDQRTFGDAAHHGPGDTRPGPSHAFQDVATGGHRGLGHGFGPCKVERYV